MLTNKKEFQKLSTALVSAIRSVIASEAEYQRAKWTPIKTFRDWKSKDFYGQYMLTENIKLYASQLRKALENPENHQRIIGPKNSGKTRLAYELFKEIDKTIPSHPEVENVLYYDLKFGSFGSIESKLLDLQVINQRKILVLDNCSYEIHEKIYNDFLFNTKISLLSIGDQLDKDNGNIKLDSQFADQIIEKISNTSGNSKHTQYILNNSNSNIKQAVALIEFISKDDRFLLGEYDQMWNQILGVELIQNKALSILEEISLFTYIGYSGQFQHQSDFIRELLQIEKIEEYAKIINQLEERGLIKITGDYIVLETFIEELAIKRLGKLVNENINEYLHKLSQNQLSKPFANRLNELSGLKSTTRIIEIFTKGDGLFSKYDFISTDEGARILMSLSEIAPLQTIDAINRALIDKSINDLMQLKKGRRNLVWTLERLCFRNETFKLATKTLYKLALAENENISNNASSQFSQLFQVYLPGTESSLAERMILLSEILASSEEKEFSVILKAINRGLGVQDWMRMGGADTQAGINLQDYRPVNDEEILIYWDQLIQMLLQIGTVEAFQIITNRFAQHFQRGNRISILNAIERVLGETKEIDKVLRQQFANILTEQNKYESGHIQILLELQKKYSSNSNEEQLNIKVVEPPYSSYKNESGKIIDQAEVIAREYARELINDDPNQLIDNIVLLLQGDQRQTINFGHEIGLVKPGFKELIDAAIENLVAITTEKQNNSLIEGYLYGVNDQTAIRNVINQYLTHPQINFHAIRLTKLLEITIEDLEKLKALIQENPNYIFSLQYLRINHLSFDEFIGFIDWLKNVEPFGRWSAIEFTNDYLSKNEEKLPNLKDFLSSLLIKEGILSSESKSLIPHHYFKKIVEKLDEVGGLDDVIIEFLTREILIYATDLNFRNEYIVYEIIDILFTKYWEKSWPIIGQSMLDMDYYGSYNLINVLKIYKSYIKENLLTWIDQYPLTAPQCVIHFVDFEIQEDGHRAWSPLVLEMFNKYGTNEIFLNELSYVLHSYSFSGSALQKLAERKSLIIQILDHPIPQVKEFAKLEIEMFDSRIKREEMFIQNVNIEFN